MPSYRAPLSRGLLVSSASLMVAAAVAALHTSPPSPQAQAASHSSRWTATERREVSRHELPPSAAASSGNASTAPASTALTPGSTATSSVADPGPMTAATPAAPPAKRQTVVPGKIPATVPSRTVPVAPASTPAAAAIAVTSSGTAVPNSDLPGWRLELSQDFSRSAALGQFAAVYPKWAGYDGGHDTSGHGTYSSAKTTSVSGGVLDEFLHTEGSSPQVMALTPPDARVSDQVYGRYAVRFKADLTPGYKIAWLLWPSNDVWSQGELDFPEADLNQSIQGYAHDVTGSPGRNAWAVDTGSSMTDWHTAVIEWSPAGLTYTLDGRSSTTADRTALPHDPMRWVLQTETSEHGASPSAAVSGHVYIDWVAAWGAA